MRLLKTDTQNGLVLEEIQNISERPRYAILSHVWGAHELLYEHIVAGNLDKTSEGYLKVIGICKFMLRQGYQYVWVDTCCVDRSNSAELQETINSMFDWLREAAVCYARLTDIALNIWDADDEDSGFRESVWFTRGWTLQELIAPKKVIFVTKEWGTLGDKVTLAHLVSEITGVDYDILCGLTPLQGVSVAKKMSWASNRQTTRLEDRAYSLLGLFGVNMPIIYGEGSKAFYRLQQAIMAQNPDHSIFAWGALGTSSSLQGLLATSPDEFEGSANVATTPYNLFKQTWGIDSDVPSIQQTKDELHIEVPVLRHADPDMQGDHIYIGLACKKIESDVPSQSIGTVGIPLARAPGMTDTYVRLSSTGMLDFDRMVAICGEWKVERIRIAGQFQPSENNETPSIPRSLCPSTFRITITANTLKLLRDHFGFTISEDLSFVDAHPAEPRDPKPVIFERQEGSFKAPEGALVEYDLMIEVPYKRILVLIFAPTKTPQRPTTSTEKAFAVGLLLSSHTSLDVQLHCSVDATSSLWHDSALPKYNPQDLKSESMVWLSEALAPGLMLNVELTRANVSADACHCLLDIKLKAQPGKAQVIDEDGWTSLDLSQDVVPVPPAFRWVQTAAGFMPQDAIEMKVNVENGGRNNYFIVRARKDSQYAILPGVVKKHCTTASIFALGRKIKYTEEECGLYRLMNGEDFPDDSEVDDDDYDSDDHASDDCSTEFSDEVQEEPGPISDLEKFIVDDPSTATGLAFDYEAFAVSQADDSTDEEGSESSGEEVEVESEVEGEGDTYRLMHGDFPWQDESSDYASSDDDSDDCSTDFSDEVEEDTEVPYDIDKFVVDDPSTATGLAFDYDAFATELRLQEGDVAASDAGEAPGAVSIEEEIKAGDASVEGDNDANCVLVAGGNHDNADAAEAEAVKEAEEISEEVTAEEVEEGKDVATEEAKEESISGTDEEEDTTDTDGDEGTTDTDEDEVTPEADARELTGELTEEWHYEVLAGDASSVAWRPIEGRFAPELVDNRAILGGHQGPAILYIAQVEVQGAKRWAVVQEGQLAFQPDEKAFFSDYSVLVHA